MLFSLGGIEFLVIIAVAVAVLSLYVVGDRRYRVGVPVLVCSVLAAVVTPADLLSMLLLFSTFIAMFWFGSRYCVNPSTVR